MKIFILSLFIALQSFTHAGTEPRLIAFASDQGGYPAKALCYFSNNYMNPHPQGLLVLYTCLGGPEINSEIWLVNESSKHIGTSAFGNLFSEPFVRGEEIFFFEFNEFETLKFYKFSAGRLSELPLPSEFKSTHLHELTLIGDKFFFRWTNHQTGEHGEGVYDGNFRVLPSRGVSFFWKPATNGEIMIQKTKLDSGEVVELRSGNKEPIVILKDRKADPSSPFLYLRNQFGLSGSKWATIATTETGLTLVMGEGSNFKTEDLSAHFKDIQHWAPALSSDGEIIFRGTDHNKEFALWGFKNGIKRRVLGSGLEIVEGTETVITSSRALLYNSPVFDASGKLFIGVGLRSPESSVDVGQGVVELPR